MFRGIYPIYSREENNNRVKGQHSECRWHKISAPHRALCNCNEGLQQACWHQAFSLQNSFQSMREAMDEGKIFLPRRESSSLFHEVEDTANEKNSLSTAGETEWNITEALDERNCHHQQLRASSERGNSSSWSTQEVIFSWKTSWLLFSQRRDQSTQFYMLQTLSSALQKVTK